MDIPQILGSAGIEIANILGPLAIEITSELAARRLERLWNHLQQYRGKIDIEKVLRVEAVRANPNLYNYLEFHFSNRPTMFSGNPVKMMTRTVNGRKLTMPVCFLWSGNNLHLKDIEDLNVRRHPNWEEAQYVHNQRLLGRRIEDKVVYEAKTIHIESSYASINPGLTTYGSALATQDALEWELLSEAVNYFVAPPAIQDFQRIMRCLKMRGN